MRAPRRRGWFGNTLRVPIYPLLVNLYFVVFIFQANHYQLRVADTLDYLAVSTLAMAAILVAAHFLVPRLLPLTAVVLVFAFLYFAVPEFLLVDLRSQSPRVVPHLIWAALLLAASGLVVMNGGRLAPGLAVVCNVWAFLTILWSTGSFAYQYLDRQPATIDLVEQGMETAGLEASVRPHIIHIMLDAYNRDDVLAREYGFDNSDFLDALEERGFRIARAATTPYNQTSLSLSATFLGGYFDSKQLAKLEENDIWLRRRLMDKITMGPTQQVLKQQGYRFFATAVGLTGMYRYPEESMLLGAMPQGERWTFEHTILYKRNINAIAPLAKWLNWSSLRQLNQDLRFAFDFNRFGAPIAAAIADGAPIHLYQHILTPHPPYTVTETGEDTAEWLPITQFIATGNAIILGDARRRLPYIEGYLEKLRYTNRALLAHIDRIMTAIPEPRVIIIHGDHGGSVYYNHDTLDSTCVSERYGVLFAVHSRPEIPFIRDDQSGVYNTVNVYRDLFAGYFGARTPPLPAKSHFAPWNHMRQIEPVDLGSAKACKR